MGFCVCSTHNLGIHFLLKITVLQLTGRRPRQTEAMTIQFVQRISLLPFSVLHPISFLIQDPSLLGCCRLSLAGWGALALLDHVLSPAAMVYILGASPSYPRQPTEAADCAGCQEQGAPGSSCTIPPRPASSLQSFLLWTPYLVLAHHGEQLMQKKPHICERSFAHTRE